jgi:hypothetical protein
MELRHADLRGGVDRLKQARTWEKRHDVQFYDNHTFLCQTVGRYLAEGIKAAQPAIIIATPPHRHAFAAELGRLGIDIETLRPLDLVWLDARETMSAFLEGGSPNAELFEATVGNVLERVIEGRRYTTVRAYGEMVDLLWREGKPEAAVALEEMWNALATKYAFSLLCAYSKESFQETHSLSGIERICALHTHVLSSRARSTE